MIRRPPRSTQSRSSAASDVYKRQVVAGAPAFLRRARGFTPAPIRLAHEVPCVVALGAQLKATVTVTRGCEAFVSQHVGDLDTPAAVGTEPEAVEREPEQRSLDMMLG